MAPYTIHTGDNQKILDLYPDDHFDAIVTDPPYGIEFLGKDWDSNTGAINTWRQCLRVLKPGGYLLAFSAARTYHHLASNIESVGFEIRDQLMWLYASGFPKAQDIGKAIQRRLGVKEIKTHNKLNGYAKEQTSHGAQRVGDVNKDDYENTITETIPTSPEAVKWSGWKTALKPAHEPIVMARKPFKGSTIDNVLKHGVGALNIDDSRIPFENNKDFQSAAYGQDKSKTFGYINTEQQDTYSKQDIIKVEANQQGRFPSNVMGEIEGYQKFFYSPKVSRRERHCGFEQTHISAPFGDVKGAYQDGERFAVVHQKLQDPLAHIPTTKGGMYDVDGTGVQYNAHKLQKVGNNHPTVKPVALMRYLINLVAPKNSTILDPFTGSGSTGMAACELGHTFVGCELDPHYVDIAKRRIEGWIQPNKGDLTHINTYDRREDGLESAGIQGIQQLRERRDNRPNPQDLFEDE